MRRTVRSSVGAALALACILAIVGSGSASTAELQHGISFAMGCSSPTGVGGSVSCSYSIVNVADEANETLTIDGLEQVVHAQTGTCRLERECAEPAAAGVHRARHVRRRSRQSVDRRDELRPAAGLRESTCFPSRATRCWPPIRRRCGRTRRSPGATSATGRAAIATHTGRRRVLSRRCQEYRTVDDTQHGITFTMGCESTTALGDPFICSHSIPERHRRGARTR